MPVDPQTKDLLVEKVAIIDAEVDALRHCLTTSNTFIEFRDKYIDSLRNVEGTFEEKVLRGFGIRYSCIEEGVLERLWLRNDIGEIEEFETLGEAEKRGVQLGLMDFVIKDLAVNS